MPLQRLPDGTTVFIQWPPESGELTLRRPAEPPRTAGSSKDKKKKNGKAPEKVIPMRDPRTGELHYKREKNGPDKNLQRPEIREWRAKQVVSSDGRKKKTVYTLKTQTEDTKAQEKKIVGPLLQDTLSRILLPSSVFALS